MPALSIIRKGFWDENEKLYFSSCDTVNVTDRGEIS